MVVVELRNSKNKVVSDYLSIIIFVLARYVTNKGIHTEAISSVRR